MLNSELLIFENCNDIFLCVKATGTDLAWAGISAVEWTKMKNHLVLHENQVTKMGWFGLKSEWGRPIE